MRSTHRRASDPLKREPVDLLFDDVVVPGGLDGVELARLAHTRWPALGIMLTSGFPQARLDYESAAHSNFKLLSKPYRRIELAAAVRAALGHATQGPDASRTRDASSPS